MLFQKLDEFFDELFSDSIELDNFQLSKICALNWNEIDWKTVGITCKAHTPGNVKQSCPDICNRLKTGKYNL